MNLGFLPLSRSRRGFGALDVSIGFLLLAGLAGCGRARGPADGPTAPVNASSEAIASAPDAAEPAPAELDHQAFYPLEVGRAWSYDRDVSFVIVMPSGYVGQGLDFRYDTERRIIGTERRGDVSYVVESDRWAEDGEPMSDPSRVHWWRYRQDRTGLYEADVSGREPPVLEGVSSSAETSEALLASEATPREPGTGPEVEAAFAAEIARLEHAESYRAAWDKLMERRRALREALAAGSREARILAHGRGGGARSDEIVRLVYPLRPHLRWFVRPDPRVLTIVEGHEVLDLPAGRFHGWRMRIVWPDYFGPNDSALFWYGRDGFLLSRFHFESEATDELGNVIGTIVADEEERLRAVEL
jgi:predicted small lipoprotein YifL